MFSLFKSVFIYIIIVIDPPHPLFFQVALLPDFQVPSSKFPDAEVELVERAADPTRPKPPTDPP
jgi:hypothetical protein